ncbi:MAG TPA: alpha/beta hydrolase-fold protein [Vicinamibacterales bacterium]|nr:alpha/beta hydrolase-fold protein [Vicinamibacterales bacterium]
MRRSVIGFAVAAAAALTAPLALEAQRGPAAPPFTSPEVGADRRVTLRLFAPNAKSVVASGELDGQPHPLTRADNGVWSVTVGPLAPDIYTYAFNVDGVTALDPRNANIKYGYGGFGAVNVVQVAGDGPQFYDVKPVPHGKVNIVPYVSKATGLSRTVWIYTPPGYDRGKDFPVLYLLHGAGDIESGWTMIGRANNIIDNAIAEGRARPMVVVMPLGHGIQSFWTGPARQAPDPVAAALAGATLDAIITAMMAGDGNGGLSPVTRDIVEDVLPMVERDYKVSKRPDDRAIAGLSMGGGQTVNIAFSRPELFRYVVLMSPAANANVAKIYPKFLENAAAANKQFKLFWIGVGKDDGLTGPGDRAFAETMAKFGIKHSFNLTEGRHEWTVWRHYLNDVAPLLFK